MRERLAYLHLPKAAGTSIRAALSAYYEIEQTVPWSVDRHMLGDFAEVAEIDRPVFLGDPTEFRRYQYMEGHWSLPTILAGFEPDEVACVLREPRARYLSQYTYWRSWPDAQHARWHPFEASLASRRLLSEYASDPSVACISDNLISRLVLGPHALIPSGGHIPASNIDAVAAAACEQLDRIGHVDVIERGEDTYLALEEWFGSPLSRKRLNETQLDHGERVDLDDLVDRRTLALVSDRSAADLQVWHHAASKRELSNTAVRSIADTSYAASLAKIAVHEPRTTRVEEPSPLDPIDRAEQAAPSRALARLSTRTRLSRLLRRGPKAWIHRARIEINRRLGFEAGAERAGRKASRRAGG